MAAEKISKKQLREDEFVNFFARITLYLSAHRQQLLWGVIAVAAAAVILGGFYLYRRSFDEKAAYQLSQAQETYHKAEAATSTDNLKKAKEHFEEVIKQYPSSPAAEEARYYLGTCYFQLNEYDKAISAYEDYLKKYSAGRFAPMALEGLAQSRIGKKDLIDAAKEYETLVKKYDNYPMLLEVLMSLGQLYEQMNNPPEALRIYKLVVQKFPDSPEKAQAQRKIDNIQKG